MALSLDSQQLPEDRSVEKENCKPTWEGLPAFEGSPSTGDLYDDQKIDLEYLEYVCTPRVELGREFYDMKIVGYARD